ARLGGRRQLLQGLRRVLGIFHRWADPQSRVPLVERGGVAAWVRRAWQYDLQQSNRVLNPGVPRPVAGETEQAAIH
ncbi:hypothetical protein U0070_021555, partial [Myodes glareolus]